MCVIFSTMSSLVCIQSEDQDSRQWLLYVFVWYAFALSLPTLLTLGLFSRFRDVFHYIQRKCVKIRFDFPTFIFKLNVWLREVSAELEEHTRENRSLYSERGLGFQPGYDRLRLSYGSFFNFITFSSCFSLPLSVCLSLCFPATLEHKLSRV